MVAATAPQVQASPDSSGSVAATGNSARSAPKSAGFCGSWFVPVSAGHSVSTPEWVKSCQYDLRHIRDLGFCRKPRDEPPRHSPAVLRAGVRCVFDSPSRTTTPVFDKTPKLCNAPNSATARAVSTAPWRSASGTRSRRRRGRGPHVSSSRRIRKSPTYAHVHQPCGARQRGAVERAEVNGFAVHRASGSHG